MGVRGHKRRMTCAYTHLNPVLSVQTVSSPSNLLLVLSDM